MDMVIYILGDIDFSYRILLGITMLYQDRSMHLMAATLLILFILWSFIKWSLNPEKSPYPFREFAFGIIFYMIFGGLDVISPRFDVRLETDVYQGQSFQARTINDVPLLAAVPAWLATNLFKGMRETLSPILVIPGTNIYPGMSQGIDPLTLLVKLNDMSYQATIDKYLKQTIREYAENCYVPYHEGGSNPNTQTISDLMSQPVDQFWPKAEVDVNWLFSNTYSESNPNGVSNTCKDVHTYVGSEIPSLKVKVQQHLTASNIQGSDIQTSTELIMSSLTGGTTPNPYDFMTGKFVAVYFSEGINMSNVPTMQMWANKMMFEASQKRVFERAGEANLFTQIMIPMITAIEAFAFFIAPVLMLLTVMGGVGISYIGKYLMLTLFINMWGFIKIFTDFFMLLTVHKGINGDLTVNSDYHPFSLENQNYTFMELENYLGIASSLTTAIPLFAMFLLYGGVHSMMGVMRSMQGGSVDGSNLSPSMATSMNAGTMQMADNRWSQISSTGHAVLGQESPTSADVPSQMFTNSMSGAVARESGQASTQLTAASNAVMRSINNVFSTNSSGGSTTTSGDSEVFSSSAAKHKANALSNAINAASTERSGESATNVGRFAAAVALSLSAGRGTTDKPGKMSGAEYDRLSPAERRERTDDAIEKVSKALGISADLSGFFATQYQQENGISFDKGISEALNFIDTDSSGHEFSKGVNWGKVDSSSLIGTEQNAAADLNSNAQTYTEQSAAYQQTKNMMNSGVAVNTSKNMNWSVASAAIDGSGGVNKVISMVQGLDDESKDAILSKWGSGQYDTPQEKNNALSDAIMDNYRANPDKPAAILLSTMATDMLAGENYNAASAIYRSLGDVSGDKYGSGFNTAADDIQKLSGIDAQTDKVKNITNEAGKNVKTPPNLEDTTNKAQALISAGKKDTDAGRTEVNTKANEQKLVGEDGKTTEQFNALSTNLGLKDPEKVQERFDKLNSNASKLSERENLVENANALKAGVNGIGAMMSGIQSVTDMIKGPDQSWGQGREQWANTASAIAVKSGLSAGALNEGLSNLFSYGSEDFNRLETKANDGNIEALQTLSAMNDAALLINNSGELGNSILNAIPDDNQKLRVLMAAAKTTEMTGNENGIAGISKDEFNTISQSRMAGIITDDQADGFVRLASDTTSKIPFSNISEDMQSIAYSAAYGNIAEQPLLMDIIDNADTTKFMNPSNQPDPISHNKSISMGQIVQDLQSKSESSSGKFGDLGDYYNANMVDNITDNARDLKHLDSLQMDEKGFVQGVNTELLNLDDAPEMLSNYFKMVTEKNDDGQYTHDLQTLNSNIIGAALRNPESIIGDGEDKNLFDYTAPGVLFNLMGEASKSSPLDDRSAAIEAISPGITENLTADHWSRNATSLTFLAVSSQTDEVQGMVLGMQGEQQSRIREGLESLADMGINSGVILDRSEFESQVITPVEGVGDIRDYKNPQTDTPFKLDDTKDDKNH